MDLILKKIENDICTLTINRPEQYNALNIEVLKELDSILNWIPLQYDQLPVNEDNQAIIPQLKTRFVPYSPSNSQELFIYFITFLEITKTTKVSDLFKVISNYNDLSEIRYVGGCVRKILNNEKFDDIDLATNLKPEEVKECLKNNNIVCEELE